MDNIQEILVELLRHGPAHNQLLSPLTRYIALCGDHAAETLNIPFEHQQFLHRLKALQYRTDEVGRRFERLELARVMSDILAGMPGLIASLSEKTMKMDSPLHLRMMLSSSELALLPFELANTPNGVPGAGQALALQSLQPVCITRRVRRVSFRKDYWTEHPRILFAAASPPGIAEVPVREHLLALRAAVDPWLYKYNDGMVTEEGLKDNLVFLPNASIRDIEASCRETRFTHIHILAHGVSMDNEDNLRFGLALHDSYDPHKKEIVGGEQLACALKAYRKHAEHGVSDPIMVTIAGCDSGNVGSVVGAGASVAHYLHEAGIPMVVSCQFPFTVKGSIIFVENLYERLLWGTDPRIALTDLRRTLHARLPESLDWAGIVVYDAFPPDLGDRQVSIGIDQANTSIKAALNFADQVIESEKEMKEELNNRSADENEKQEHGNENGEKKPYNVDIGRSRDRRRWIDKALSKLDAGMQRLTGYIGEGDEWNSQTSRTLGMLASAKKRKAQLCFHHISNNAHGLQLDNIPNKDEKSRLDELRKDSIKLLMEAMRYYERIFKQDIASHWAVTQYLSLYCVIHSLDSEKVDIVPTTVRIAQIDQAELKEYLTVAGMSAKLDLERPEKRVVSWAHGTLAELALLRNLLGFAEEIDKDEINAHLKKLISLGEEVKHEIYGTLRQFQRYPLWYKHICKDEFHDSADDIESILKNYPHDTPPGTIGIY